MGRCMEPLIHPREVIGYPIGTVVVLLFKKRADALSMRAVLSVRGVIRCH